MKKAFKIVLKEIKEENVWGIEPKDVAQLGEVVYPFRFKTDDDEMVELAPGDKILFKDDYPKRFKIDGEELLSTNPSNLICLK